MNNSSKYIFEAAEELGLSPEYVADYGLILIKYEGRDIYFFNSISDLNSSVASYIAKNKHTTRVILEKNNLPNISFIMPETQEEAIEFLREHKKIMVKPTYGSNSVGINVITDEEELRSLDLSESILEKFIIGEEYRYLVLDGRVIAVHYCIPDFENKTTKRISLSSQDWDLGMVEQATETAKVMGLRFASVDFLRDEKLHILEVNSAPGISSYYTPDEGEKVNVGKLLIEAVIKPT